MPEPPISIQSITLVGFRAYLHEALFDFSEKPCLALFAPNGKGKSGLVDAFEFLLSESGTIERLGIRATHNQAGVTALAHDLAADHGFPTEVRIKLKSGRTVSEAIRSTSGDRARPAELDGLLGRLMVDPIIRGYALRKFVEGHTPEDRYAEVAGWLRLSPLVEIQKNLRLLRQQIKADAEDAQPKADIDRQVARINARALTEWDQVAALNFANSLLHPLDAQPCATY
jgi:energy-coupling factor transporter ATP-binding protein EcfA2